MGSRPRLAELPPTRPRPVIVHPLLQPPPTPHRLRRPSPDHPRSAPPRAGHLIWPEVCQVRSMEGPAVRGFLLVWEAAGGGRCATRGHTDMRGLGTAGPGFRLRARRLASGVTAVGG